MTFSPSHLDDFFESVLATVLEQVHPRACYRDRVGEARALHRNRLALEKPPGTGKHMVSALVGFDDRRVSIGPRCLMDLWSE